jgi:hypothetical protein
VHPYYDDPYYDERVPYYDEEDMEGDIGPYYGPEEPDMSPEEERRYLEGYLKDLEDETAEVRKRMEQLKKKK